MFDMREYGDLLRKLVAEENKKDEGWKWSVKSISKSKARIFWGYLEYCGCKEPYFTIELEDTGEGCWIHGKDEHGGPIVIEIVTDKDLPFLNITPDKALEIAVRGIAGKAHSCY